MLLMNRNNDSFTYNLVGTSAYSEREIDVAEHAPLRLDRNSAAIAG